MTEGFSNFGSHCSLLKLSIIYHAGKHTGPGVTCACKASLPFCLYHAKDVEVRKPLFLGFYATVTADIMLLQTASPLGFSLDSHSGHHAGWKRE